jgi:four helix bundle protein
MGAMEVTMDRQHNDRVERESRDAPGESPSAVAGRHGFHSRFCHHDLAAWHVALEAMVAAHRMSRGLGRGYGPLADQLRRASQSALLQIGEGAAKRGAERAQRFRGALAEASEAAAAIEAIARLGLASQAEAARLHNELGKLCAMLVKLARAAS